VELRDFYLFRSRGDYKLCYFRYLSVMGREDFYVYFVMHVVCVLSPRGKEICASSAVMYWPPHGVALVVGSM
jgi:hypothetical protein